jgi:leucyl aminopeptidase
MPTRAKRQRAGADVTTATVSVRASSAPLREGAVVIPLFAGTPKLPRGVLSADRGLTEAATALLTRDFSGARGETRTASLVRSKSLTHVVLVGLGARDATTPEDIADALGAAARRVHEARATSVAICLDPALEAPLAADDVAHAILKGVLLAGYTYTFGKPSRAPLKRVTLLTTLPARSLDATTRRARLLADLVQRVRDWVNTPANQMTPAALAQAGGALCAQHGVSCRSWGRREIEKARMGGVLGVAAGSREEPRFIVMHYNMDKPRRRRSSPG